MTHVTCRLTAKDRDQLQNPTLGNGVWATFSFFTHANVTRSNKTRMGLLEASPTDSPYRVPKSGDFFHRFHRLTTLIIHHPSLFHSGFKTSIFWKFTEFTETITVLKIVLV